MVAPSEISRNAEGGAKRRPRWWMMAQYNAANNTNIIKAGARRAPALSNNLRPRWWHLHKLSGWGVWARHQFVEQPHQPSAQLSGLFVGHVPGRARHHPFFRRFGWQPACGLPYGRELFSELFGEIVFAKTTERADVGVMQPHLHRSLPRRDFVECHGELLAHVSV